MKIINSQIFKYTISDIQKNTESRKLCFVIGAGASVKSGIPSGSELAEKWFNETQSKYPKEEFDQWIIKEKINTKNLATHYGTIYRKRFENDKTSGYEFLVQAMRFSKPSFGHIVLAQILTKSPGHCVLTTNFDSLIETAIYQFTDKTPLVCGHESLSGYARPSKIHPLIIKIHRDLLLSPKSDIDEISNLDNGWKEPLDNIFSSHIPIVIGYGGNDGSLMSYFEKMSKPSNFFWCGKKDGDISDRIKNLIEAMDGNYVEIDGFDEIMNDLLWVFDDIKPIKDELASITKERIESFNKQFADLGLESKLKTNENYEAKKELSAYEYSTVADNEPDYEKRKSIYLEALNHFPNTMWLWYFFIHFLQFVKKDYSDLEKYYTQALSLDPNYHYIIWEYAVFLSDIKKDYDNAEKYYLKALSLEPENASNNSSYAYFLQNIRKDYYNSEKYYLKALSLEPENTHFNSNYAYFLQKVKKDYENAEKYYLKALSLDPENAHNNSNYAYFLQIVKKDYENAEKYYLKALSLDPENAHNNSNYAYFLQIVKKDYENAEKYYLKALSLDPENAHINSSYALFLQMVKKDYEKAEKYYLKALFLDPENPIIHNSYAFFLNTIKKDYENAEKYYLKALSLDPENQDISIDYASFLTSIKKDYEKADKIYLKALSLDPENPIYIGNYAYFCTNYQKSQSHADEYFLKALSLDPENYFVNLNYAIFLASVKKDNKNAEKYFLKAISLEPELPSTYINYYTFLKRIKDYENSEKFILKALSLDSNDAISNGNYAIFLASIKKDYENAEKYYLKALSLDPENALHHCNYAGLLLIMDRKKDASKYLNNAFKLNNGVKNDILIELYFYKYAHFFENLDESEKEIELLLNEGIRSLDWDLMPNVKIGIANGHPDPDKLEKFANRITNP